MNNIIIELCQEDRDRLDKIIKELANSRPNCQKCTAELADCVERCLGAKEAEQMTAAAPEEPYQQETPWTEAPVTKEEPKPEEPKAPEAKAYTEADLRRVVIALSQRGAETKAAVKAIITSYAPSVGQIPADKIGEVIGKLEAL